VEGCRTAAGGPTAARSVAAGEIRCPLAAVYRQRSVRGGPRHLGLAVPRPVAADVVSHVARAAGLGARGRPVPELKLNSAGEHARKPTPCRELCQLLFGHVCRTGRPTEAGPVTVWCHDES